MTHLKREKKKKKKDYAKKLEGDSEESTSSEEEEEEEEEEQSEEQSGLSTFAETKEEECKLVLVVRTDLGMSKGIPPFFLSLSLPLPLFHPLLS